MWKIATALLLGVCTLQFFSSLPNLTICALITFSFLLTSYYTKSKWLVYLTIFSIGFSWANLNSQIQINNKKSITPSKQSIHVIGRITNIPKYEHKNASMPFLIEEILTEDNIRKQSNLVNLKWNQAPPNLKVGDTWSLKLRISKIKNFQNPGAFDIEKLYFVKKIDAIAFVDKKAKKKFLYNQETLSVNKIREKIYNYVTQKNFHPIIPALTIGEKSLSFEQSEVFKNTGLLHLTAISGLHIGLFAGFIFILMHYLWRFLPASVLVRIPSFQVAAYSSILAAFGYSMLAGFSFATQRALIMIICFMMSNYIFHKHLSIWQRFWLALIVILCIYPISVLDIGFWLSFSTLAIILYYKESNLIKMQLALFLGMLPISLYIFQEYSFISPITNLIAIPYFSIVTIPAAILGTTLSLANTQIADFFLTIADTSIQILYPLLEFFSNIKINSLIQISHIGVLFSVFIGILLLTLPKKFPGKFLGIFFLLAIFYSPPPISYGNSKITVLDVGQGLSVLVQTQNHTLLYDTGPRFGKNDAGNLAILPFLNYKKINHLDMMVISHPDSDHIGGAESIYKKKEVKKILISDSRMFNKGINQDCRQGQSWQWDGVKFEVLHPMDLKNKKRNEHSCVIKVTSQKSSILLTGDIEKKSEKQLSKKNIQSDFLLIPHHGSNTSSSLTFIKTVNPKYALVSAGFNNMYGHPKDKVLQRYYDNGISVYNTISCGAIQLNLNKRDISCYTDNNKYWNN